VRSALLAVPGVKSAKVTLDDGLALVAYNPRLASVEDLIKAVNQAPGPLSSIQYSAALKPSKR
jgi:copper chaperone CopZ